MTVAVVVEGDTDLPIVRKMVADAGLTVAVEIDCAGKNQLDADFAGYNGAAQGWPWFVLRDLDDDAVCGGAFVDGREVKPSRWMCFRLAVRELEAWLLADTEAIAAFLGVPEGTVPTDPDAEPDPTRTIVNLARRSRRQAIRRALVPKPGMSAAVGPLYEARIIEFGQEHWSLGRASERSRSLRSARGRLRELASRWAAYIGEGKPPDAP